jgi:uncharacterized protein (DUF1697 family)
MPIFVSFLRGINVGGKSQIPMEALRALYRSLGFPSVKTHLNSGNVIFAAPGRVGAAALAKRIEGAIEKEFGFRPAVMLRTPAELDDTLAHNPFREEEASDPSRLLVMFLAAAAAKDAAQRLGRASDGPEKIEVGKRETYLYYPNGIGRSKLTTALLERHLGTAGTARNWRTVSKVREMAVSAQKSH